MMIFQNLGNLIMEETFLISLSVSGNSCWDKENSHYANKSCDWGMAVGPEVPFGEDHLLPRFGMVASRTMKKMAIMILQMFRWHPWLIQTILTWWASRLGAIVRLRAQVSYVKTQNMAMLLKVEEATALCALDFLEIGLAPG
jgi:hypothetical protein